MKLRFVNQDVKKLREYCGYRIWRKPQEGVQYALGADVAEGVGGDASCAIVLDCRTGFHVASFWSNLIDTDNYAAELYKLGSWYNRAFMCIEANNHGHAVIAHLSGAIGGLTYPNLYKRIEYDEYTQRKTKKIGFVETRQTKPRIIENLKSDLKGGDVSTADRETIQELGNFVRNEKTGRLGCEGNAHDDRVIAFALANEQRRVLCAGDSTKDYRTPPVQFDPQTGFPTGTFELPTYNYNIF